MARSLSSAARFVSAFSESTALTLRRGYAAAPSPAMLKGSSEVKVLKKVKEGTKDDSSSSWVPDPKTGFYRPANKTDELDPAELRELLLSKRSGN